MTNTITACYTDLPGPQSAASDQHVRGRDMIVPARDIHVDNNSEQATLLQGAMVRALELHPNATVIYVSTSDDSDSTGYGFTLNDIVDAEGQTLLKTPEQQDEAMNALADFLSNLRWRGMVGEDKRGEGKVPIQLPEDLTYDIDFTVAERFHASLTSAQIRERFGMEPGELMARVGGHTELLQEPLAALRKGTRAERGVAHTLVDVRIRAPKHSRNHAF